MGNADSGLSILVGIATGVLAHQATKRISVSEIGRFISERAILVAVDVKETVEEYAATRALSVAPSGRDAAS